MRIMKQCDSSFVDNKMDTSTVNVAGFTYGILFFILNTKKSFDFYNKIFKLTKNLFRKDLAGKTNTFQSYLGGNTMNFESNTMERNMEV